MKYIILIKDTTKISRLKEFTDRLKYLTDEFKDVADSPDVDYLEVK